MPHQQLTAGAGLINFEHGILGILNIAEDQTVRMGEPAVAVRSPAPRLSKAVSRLESRRFVERSTCLSDGRAISVRLTQNGRRAWLRATPPHVALARDTIFGDLNSEQLPTLADLLEPIIARIDPNKSLGRLPARAPTGTA